MLATIFSRVPSSLLRETASFALCASKLSPAHLLAALVLSVAQKEEQKEYLIERIAAK
jgi:hypothetical protein